MKVLPLKLSDIVILGYKQSLKRSQPAPAEEECVVVLVAHHWTARRVDGAPSGFDPQGRRADSTRLYVLGPIRPEQVYGLGTGDNTWRRQGQACCRGAAGCDLKKRSARYVSSKSTESSVI